VAFGYSPISGCFQVDVHVTHHSSPLLSQCVISYAGSYCDQSLDHQCLVCNQESLEKNSFNFASISAWFSEIPANERQLGRLDAPQPLPSRQNVHRPWCDLLAACAWGPRGTELGQLIGQQWRVRVGVVIACGARWVGRIRRCEKVAEPLCIVHVSTDGSPRARRERVNLTEDFVSDYDSLSSRDACKPHALPSDQSRLKRRMRSPGSRKTQTRTSARDCPKILRCTDCGSLLLTKLKARGMAAQRLHLHLDGTVESARRRRA
jgi:hypothetical protein